MAKQKEVVENVETEVKQTEQTEQTEQSPQFVELTIARALNEIKMISKRIAKESSLKNFVAYQKGTNGTVTPTDTEDFAAIANSIKSLIERRAMIKNAIAVANSSQVISAAGYTMTITSALAMKETLNAQEQFLSNAKSNFNYVRSRVEDMNDDVNEKLQNLLVANFGKDKRPGDSDVGLITTQFLENNEYKIINEEIHLNNFKMYEEFIDSFRNEIDFALSEANATIKIQIPA